MNECIRIAIASGKGGTGKTLISTNLFYVLQSRDLDVTLVDCDAEEPNDKLFFSFSAETGQNVNIKIPQIDAIKCTFCGRCRVYCSYNAIFLIQSLGVIKVIDELCHSCSACIVACEKNAIIVKEVGVGKVITYISNNLSDGYLIEANMNVGVYSPVPVIKAAVKKSGNNGIILLDAPPGTSCPFIHTVVNADHVILVTEPTPFGLSDLKQSVEVLRGMNKTFSVIINRSGIGDRGVYHYLEQECIHLLVEIPYKKSIAQEYSSGSLVVKTDSEIRSKFSTIVNYIVKIWK